MLHRDLWITASLPTPTQGTLVPDLVILDVNGTLFGLDPVAARLADVGLAGRLDTWFARILRDGFAAAAAGSIVPFVDLARHHLEVLMDEEGLDADDAAVSTVIGGFQEVVAHDDVEPALRRLSSAGVPVVTMTNGSVDITDAFLEREGLDSLVAATYDVTMAGRWKPASAAYAYVLEQQGVSAETAALVAVHPWDVHGAAQAGLATGWVDRNGTRYPRSFRAPDVRGTSMDEVVAGLLARDDIS